MVASPSSSLAPNLPSTTKRIFISCAERENGITSLGNIQAGVHEMHTNGFVILENVISPAFIDKLHSRMLEDTKTTLAWDGLVFNQGFRTNFSQTPPLTDEFIIEEIYANRHAIDIMENVIGPRPRLSMMSSNIELPNGKGRQAVHSDAYADILPFPFGIEIYIYLDDVSSENGSTEIWPGTHIYTENEHVTDGRGWIKKTSMDMRAQVSPPIQLPIPKGSLCMRDLRIWHAGVANRSDRPRIMLALIYFPRWFKSFMRITLPESVRAKVASWDRVDLTTNTSFVEGPVDHLKTKGNMNSAGKMNFTQDESKALIDYRAMIDRQLGRPENVVVPVTANSYWTPREDIAH